MEKRKKTKVPAVRADVVKATEAVRVDPRRIRSSFDVAQNTANNVNHWKAADALDADAAANPFVRQRIRDRSRYEIANNTYARGIVDTLANDLIGTGPRLQMQTSDDDFNRKVETSYARWSKAIGLNQKLSLAAKSESESGEVFFIFKDNPKTKNSVTLDVQLIEAERVADPNMMSVKSDPLYVDGITFDVHQNPISYDVLKTHPGSKIFGFVPNEFDRIDARFVIHLFKPTRPGQNRGLPALSAALPLFAQLRRYTLATISAAETAANNSYVMHTLHASVNEDDVAASTTPFEEIDLARNMATVMPEGWGISQMKPEQPVTAYPDFKHEILNEIARVVGMPFNIAAANSSGYNYASGRLDHQTYFRTIQVGQSRFSEIVLNRIFNVWFFEAARTGDQFGTIPKESMRRTWFFDGFEHIDPAREAKAQDMNLKNFSTTYASIYARKGLDWSEEFDQIAIEQKALRDKGITADDVEAAIAASGEPELKLVGA